MLDIDRQETDPDCRVSPTTLFRRLSMPPPGPEARSTPVRLLCGAAVSRFELLVACDWLRSSLTGMRISRITEMVPRRTMSLCLSTQSSTDGLACPSWLLRPPMAPLCSAPCHGRGRPPGLGGARSLLTRRIGRLTVGGETRSWWSWSVLQGAAHDRVCSHAHRLGPAAVGRHCLQFTHFPPCILKAWGGADVAESHRRLIPPRSS